MVCTALCALQFLQETRTNICPLEYIYEQLNVKAFPYILNLDEMFQKYGVKPNWNVRLKDF